MQDNVRIRKVNVGGREGRERNEGREKAILLQNLRKA